MDWTHNTLWLDELDPRDLVTVEYRGNLPTPADTQGAGYVRLYKFKAKQGCLREVSGVRSARYIELAFSNITSLEGIAALGHIKRLELSWCLKLNSDVGLAEIGDHLEWLHIEKSRRFVPTVELFGLRKLRVLCLNGCGPLQSLSFLDSMPQLLDFRFVGTNVLDGDLSPLVRHPRLVNAGFLDKRHYNLKHAQVEAALAGRRAQVVEYVQKGEFRTFRYRGLGEHDADI